jgi:tRNA nucleotidyltransferase (CCA-adding enzyme)
MQFAARFDLTIAPETATLCRQIISSYGELAVERVREEWLKWAQKSTVPSRGLHWLRDTGWLVHFPEVNALVDVPQDPEWHPEGDVFVHTCHCLDALVTLPAWQAANPETRAILSFAVLAHDFAKSATTHEAERDGRMRIVSPGHEDAGGPLAAKFLERINVPLALGERVIPLVTNHLAHLQTLTDRAVRRLAKRLEPATIEELVVVITADQFGRPPRPREISENVRALEARAGELKLQASAPQPILMGRHLIELGLKPGPAMGTILEAAFEAQLEGDFATLPAALCWLRGQAALPLSDEVRAKLREG